MKFLILLFFIFRVHSWIKKNVKSVDPTDTSMSTPKKNLDDVLGDFIKNLENKNSNKPTMEPVLANADSHKASSDSHKKLDWQDVSRTRISEKKQLINRKNYSNVSHHNENIELENNAYELVDEEFQLEGNQIDLKQAVIYKEILERKYFSI